MRKALLFLLAGACWAQTQVDYVTQIRRKPISAATTVPSSCTVTGNLFVLTTTNQFYVCNAGVYVIATASATPAGATTQIQYNNAGAFGASANLFFTSGNLNNTGSATNGFRAPVFNALNNSTVNPSSDAFTTSDQSVHITGAGNIFGQSLALTNGWTGGSGAYGMTGGGALTVSSCAGCGAGTVGGATTQIQYNNSGAFGASANFSWNNGAAVMNVGEITPTSGIRSPVFSALNNSTHNASSDAFTTSDQSFHVTGAGNILGQSLALTNGWTGGAGAYGMTGGGALTVASCTGCGGGGGTPGGSTTQIQYNNAGAFAGSANFSWNNSAAVMNVGEVTPTSGIRSPVFSALNNSSHNAASDAFTTSDQSAHITGAGNIYGQGLAVTGGITAGAGAYGVNSSGAFTGSSIKTGANNGTIATVGAGAEINKTGSSISIQAYDTGGSCGIGTGATAPGILCSSDQRLKTALAPLQSGLSEILRLNPGTFHWLGSRQPGVGFIAQDVEKILPNLIAKDPKNGYLMLSEDGMIPYLVKSIQELQAEIEDLKRGQSNSPLRTNARAQR